MSAGKLIKDAVFAGQFYEGQSSVLENDLAQMRAYASEVEYAAAVESVRAVIVPHAGYVFSGRTAFRTLYTARNRNFKRSLIIAPSHRVSFKGIAFADYAGYRTPLGTLKTDLDAIGQLKSMNSPLLISSARAHDQEHALEVELPMLKFLFGDISIIPFVCGGVTLADAEAIADMLLPFWNEETLWVISSDFTHYGGAFGYQPFSNDVRRNIEKLDSGAIEKILALDLEGFHEYQEKTHATICGENPIMILLALLKKISAAETLKSRLVEYTTSGAMTGDYTHCVSYAGINFSN